MSDQSPVSEEMLELLRCPVAVQNKDKEDPGRLRLYKGTWLICDESGYKYPIRAGIPVMLPEEGEKWKETADEDLPVPPPDK